jgi:cupin 2 domain-containing protein
MIAIHNLFANLSGDTQAEQTTALLSHRHLRIERIVSYGQSSPPNFWYDQEQAEWVILLTGSAGLRFEGEACARTLRAGDCVDIPAHTRHRIDWTDATQPTIWLAVHYS